MERPGINILYYAAYSLWNSQQEAQLHCKVLHNQLPENLNEKTPTHHFQNVFIS